MSDNPLHMRVFGDDSARREAALRHLFTTVLTQYQPKGSVLGAFREDTLVGVCAMVKPARCQPSSREKLALLGAMTRGRAWRAVPGALRWTSSWASRDPAAPHW